MNSSKSIEETASAIRHVLIYMMDDAVSAKLYVSAVHMALALVELDKTLGRPSDAEDRLKELLDDPDIRHHLPSKYLN